MNAPPRPARQKRSGPRFLGRYEVIGELARGGMGTVYLARHAGEAGFQRLFAVKVLHPHLAEEAGFVDMLRDEARIAARIHHPNVVAVVDIGTQGDNHYIVMEYVEGPSFSTLWKRSRDKRPLEMSVSVMIDTLEGLHAAHTLSDEDGVPLHLVHRDVSPQNVLVGVDGVARITDFGIAKAESRISSTQPGMRKGKLQFMSPEQIKDAEKIDHRTDVWAAGVVLYSLLTGEHLFRDENDAATVHNVISKEIPSPSTRAEKPPAAFDAVVAKALERDPNLRFDTALDMAEALRKAAAEAGVLGSRHAVARWVTTTFGEELESRRAAIREVTRRHSSPSESREHSQVTVLPSLPSSLTNQIPDPNATPTSVKLGGFEEEILPSEAIVTVPPPPMDHGEVVPIVDPLARKKRIAIGIAVALALFVLSGLLIRFSTTKPSEEAAAHPDKPVVTAEPVSVGVGTPAAEPPAAAASEAREEPAPVAPERPAEIEKRAKAVHRVPSKPVVSVAPSPKPEQPPAAAPAEPAAPRPTAAPQPEFETNPYLRR